MDTQNKKEVTGCPLIDNIVGCRMLDGQLTQNYGDETGRGRVQKKTRKMKKDERKRAEKKTQNDEARKNKVRKEKTLTEKFVYMVFFVMLIILIMMIVSLIYINRELSMEVENIETLETLETLTKEKMSQTEGTLLATGIAIIGVAIAVWAGLNIIQVLEKDKFELLGKEVSNYRDERKHLNRTRFLESVAKENNELNKYLYNRLVASIDEEHDEISAELYFELNVIEGMFQVVYNGQNCNERILKVQYYSDSIRKCKEQMKYARKIMSNSEVIEQYLKIRIYEFYFYQGYIDKEKSRDCFQNVINGFCEIFGGLKEPKNVIKEDGYLDGSALLTAYMLNTIGEAYSKIIHSYETDKMLVTKHMEGQSERVKEYYGALIELIHNVKDKQLIREVYYRNYGAALERIGRYIKKDKPTTFTYSSEIRELYQTALNIVMCGYEGVEVRQQTFYVWLSFYIKVMQKENIISLIEDKELKHDPNKKRESLEKYTNNALHYVDIALKMFPTLPFYRRCYAFVQRDLAIWEICKGKLDTACKHVGELNKTLKEIDVVEEIRSQFENEYLFPDNYLVILQKDRDELQKIIREA